jgi:hypothetical protein
MRTSHKAKDAAAEKQSYACDTFTGHGKAHQPPLPGSPVRVFPVNVTSGRLSARIRRQVMYPRPVHGAGIPRMPGPGPDPSMSARGC